MEPTLRACPVLAKDGYGWQQYQASAFCESTDEADRFYERQGAFLALFYFLCGSDGIAGNFIICRDHPIWVDTECMFVPNLPQRSTASYIPLWIRESVLTTGFIFWGNTMGVQPRAHSALSASCLEDRSHVFGIDDVLNSRYVDAVKRGFVNSYDWILSRRDAWSSDRAPLNWWLGQWNRVIPHPTSVYSVLSDALLVAPVDMKAQARRAVIEILRRSTSNACCWPSDLVHADLMALERGDIPIWWTSPLRRDLYGPSGQVARDIISRTGLERMRFRLGRLSPGDRDSQLWLTDTHLRINVVV
jgi:lantibiotic modifying enzyme